MGGLVLGIARIVLSYSLGVAILPLSSVGDSRVPLRTKLERCIYSTKNNSFIGFDVFHQSNTGTLLKNNKNLTKYDPVLLTGKCLASF